MSQKIELSPKLKCHQIIIVIKTKMSQVVVPSVFGCQLQRWTDPVVNQAFEDAGVTKNQMLPITNISQKN